MSLQRQEPWYSVEGILLLLFAAFIHELAEDYNADQIHCALFVIPQYKGCDVHLWEASGIHSEDWRVISLQLFGHWNRRTSKPGEAVVTHIHHSLLA